MEDGDVEEMEDGDVEEMEDSLMVDRTVWQPGRASTAVSGTV